jgi:predicted ATPase
VSSARCWEVSRLQPLVLFSDDLHWADISTIDILNYLAGRLSDMRVLVLTSYRPADMALANHPFLAIRSDLQSRGLFEEIGLAFLSTADVVRYLSLEFPNHRFPADFAAAIHAKTEGSPLFMVDLLRTCATRADRQGGRPDLARGMPEVLKDLPESVRG